MTSGAGRSAVGSAVRFRQATVRDVPQLHALQLEGWNEDYVGYMPDAYAPKALARYGTPEAIAAAIARYRYYFVAVQGGEVVGSICADHVGDGEAELYWIHVGKRHRRQGLGAALLAHLLEALDPSLHTLGVTTFTGYEPTLAFYRAQGFAHEQRVESNYDGVDVNDTKLKRTLRRAPRLEEA